MIMVRLSGGLGNQMFQYAFGRANAMQLGVELTLDTSDKTLMIHTGFELLRLFNIQAREATKAEKKIILGLQYYWLTRKITTTLGISSILNTNIVAEHRKFFTPDILATPDNSYIIGYWQSEKYFSNIINQIRSDFSFKPQLSAYNMKLVEEIRNQNSISLHIRRNDFVKSKKVNTIHGLCSMNYYHAAIEHITKHVESPCFFIFSDDIEWVKENLKINFPKKYIEHNKNSESYNDMRLMSFCKHNIIANSTFSWWGAWLNKNQEKIVISPKNWFEKKIMNEQFYNIYPKQWIKL